MLAVAARRVGCSWQRPRRHTFSATLPLTDHDGLQLDGSYAVRAFLTPAGNALGAPSAVAQVKVVIAAQ